MPYGINRTAIYMLMKFCCYTGDIVVNNKYIFMGLDMHIYIENRYFFLEQNNYDNILDASYFLNNTNGKIYNKSYQIILEKAKKGDFVFLDPPYIEKKKYYFNYNKNEILDDSFIKDLYKQVRILDKKGVKWMMTQADTKEIKDIFKEYTIKKFKVYRMNKKIYVNELIIMNY